MYLCSSQFPILQDQKPQHHPVLGNREPPGVDSFPTQLCEAEEPLKMQWIPGWPGVLYTSIDGLKAIYNPVVHHFPIFSHFKMPFSVGVKKNPRDFSGPLRMT